jgi:predicted MFS family arabinose efflux permease
LPLDPNTTLEHHVYETFDWRWVSVGFLFMVGAQVGAYWLLRPILNDLIFRQERVVAGAALLAGTALLIYFLGGLLIGRMSAGHSVKEPAVGGVLAITAIFVLQLLLGQVNIVGLVIGAPFCFGVAYLGGLAGEKWQDRVRRPRPRPSSAGR